MALLALLGTSEATGLSSDAVQRKPLANIEEWHEGCGGPLHAARGPASGDRLRSLTENELPSRVEDDPTFCGTWIYVALVGVDYTPGLLAHVLRFGGWTPLAPTPVSKRRWARSPRDMHFIHQ